MEFRGRDGWIEVICGSMFAGKTEELIRRITRIRFAKKEVIVFKPVIDDTNFRTPAETRRESILFYTRTNGSL